MGNDGALRQHTVWYTGKQVPVEDSLNHLERSWIGSVGFRWRFRNWGEDGYLSCFPPSAARADNKVQRIQPHDETNPRIWRDASPPTRARSGASRVENRSLMLIYRYSLITGKRGHKAGAGADSRLGGRELDRRSNSGMQQWIRRTQGSVRANKTRRDRE